jgi:hypothetical protein
MRKVSWGALVGMVALIVTGVAVAHGGGSKSASAVAATISATAISDAKTTTCTNADGTWTKLNATFTGSALGDADLSGPARLTVRALINTTKNLGTVAGTLRIDTAGEADTKLAFATVYSGGKLAGLASGRAHDPGASVLANISSTFSPTSGFTGGKIGGTTDGGSAVELAAGDCASTANDKAVLHLRGTVVSASATSLVVKSGTDQVTCAVSSGLSADVAKLQAGQPVSAVCTLSGGSYQLQSLGGKRDEHADKRDLRHDKRYHRKHH